MGRIIVLAGPNGAGKSSVGGMLLREHGLTYFNPDEAALKLVALQPSLPSREANSRAWFQGKRGLERAIARGVNYNFETTLGGRSITQLLQRAVETGVEVWVWYVALSSPELHLERVRARAADGGHDLTEIELRRRYDTSRLHLIELMPGLSRLVVYDNSRRVDLGKRERPRPRLLLKMTNKKIVDHCDLATTPTWARPIFATAFAIDPSALKR